MNEEQFTIIYNKALDLLSRREHSKKEISDKLLIRFDDKEIIDSVIDKLNSNNLINDYRFAELYVMSRKRKGFGPKKIAFELLGKGINESVSKEIISNEGGWNQVAKKVFTKKFKEGPCQEPKLKLKQKSFLQNRGFTFREIESVFANDMLWFDAMSYEVLARKYRPIDFNEVIGQDHVVKALINSINQEKIHQAFIFSGTRGIGKTTIARILAKCLNCESSSKPTPDPCNECSNTKEISTGRSVDFLEIDAASNTQVEKIRDLIETVEYKPAKARFKIYLIDEVHMLSPASFNALLKTLEEPPPHVIFIFATTNPEKIPKTVQSRCLQLNLKTVDEEILSSHLKKILEKEKINYDNDSVSLIANTANGSVRDGLTLLDQAIAYGNGELLKEDVKALLGTIDNSLLIELIGSVIDGNGKKTFDLLSQIEELTPEYDNILKDIISTLHQISLHQIVNNSESNDIKELSTKIDKEFCQLLYEIAMNAYSKFSVHPNPKEALEICLLRMLTFNPLQKLSEGISSNKDDSAEKKNFKKSELKVQKPKDIKVINKNIFKNNEDWISFFNNTEMSPFVRNYFGNMSLESFKENKLTLIKDSKIGDIPENIILEFKSVVKGFFEIEVEVFFEVGNVVSSPLSLKDIKHKEDMDIAQKSIYEDQDIKEFMKKFNGKIKTDTIKPIK